MAADDALTTETARFAVLRLNAALDEQARLSDAYALAAGTSSGQSWYFRLQAASLHVSRCDRAVKAGTAHMP